jgi:molybdopterin-guanine dinucleotide biosynthesis protein A
LALRRSLKNNLQDYLDSGQRKVLNWLNQQNMIKVNFEDEPEIFVNINTLTELAELEEFMPSP